MQKPIISADSHITEPPNTYIDFIDPKFQDRAPHMVRDERKGDLFMIDGMSRPIPMGLIAAARQSRRGLTLLGIKLKSCIAADGTPRRGMADQDRDGVAAEVIYPTVGMLLCNKKK